MCTRNQAFEILKSVYHACDPILGHSIHDAILYGSYARGDFTAESDIDILLTADLTQEQIASQRRAENTTAIRTPRSWTQWCFSYFSCVFNAFTPCLTQSILDV